jgi:hypothetical protein
LATWQTVLGKLAGKHAAGHHSERLAVSLLLVYYKICRLVLGSTKSGRARGSGLERRGGDVTVEGRRHECVWGGVVTY